MNDIKNWELIHQAQASWLSANWESFPRQGSRGRTGDMVWCQLQGGNAALLRWRWSSPGSQQMSHVITTGSVSRVTWSWVFFCFLTFFFPPKNHIRPKKEGINPLLGLRLKPRKFSQFISVAQLCLTLCDPMDCSTPGLPVHHQLAEFTQTHVHRVGDAIQPSRPLSSPSPPAFNLSQHQGSFQMSQFCTSGGQSTGVSASTSVLPMNIQDRFPLEWTGWISLQSKGLSRVFSNPTVQKHQFFGSQLSL